MRYVSQCTLAPQAGGLAVGHVFSMNGLYDPDYTGTGHQPLGYDQYMNFYHHYTVTHAKIKVTFLANASAAQGLVYLSRNSGVAVITARDDLAEQPSTKLAPIQKDGAAKQIVLTDSVNLSTLLGQNVLNEDNNAGAIASNPVEGYYWHVSAASFDGNIGSTVAVVEIDYKVVLHEPKDLAGS